jgi:hypothetical protein
MDVNRLAVVAEVDLKGPVGLEAGWRGYLMEAIAVEVD